MLTWEQAERFARELRQAAEQAAAPGCPAWPDPPLPERIGRYRILRLIGSGGMGTVYEAQQERPNRTVAIKVLAPGVMPPDRFAKALRRFEREVELLGTLQHPGIAQVFDTGTFSPLRLGPEEGPCDGRVDAGAHSPSPPPSWSESGFQLPFIVMEFIPEALSVTGFADAEHLSVRLRLELFAQACDAIQYAHQKGVIHRDLKPANILVGMAPYNSPRPKVIDFGIARAMDSDVTLTLAQGDVREFMGTLPYMSPEQCSGDPSQIDARSDIYSLGVILYELLTGQLPFDLSRTPIPHAARVIQERDPPRPSVIRKGLRGDLEAVVLKAIQKDRDTRYQSAGELARDIRCHLTGQPVEARMPSRWMRAARWAGRHPVAATTALCITVAGLVSGLTIGMTRWYGLEPYALEPITWTDATHREPTGYRLVSRAGLTLGTIGDGVQGVHFAKLAARDRRFGGGKVVLFSAGDTLGTHVTAGQLRMAEAADLDHVLWETKPGAPFIEAPNSLARPGDVFVAPRALVADVFDDDSHAGDEIIAVHLLCGGSPSALRVYDFSGAILFEAWHYGPIQSIRWQEESKLLYATGDRHGIDWSKAAEDPRCRDLVQGDRPQVVFALRPQVGTAGGFIHSEYDPVAARCLVWYECLAPVDLASRFEMRIAPHSLTRPGCVDLNVDKDGCGVTLTIDAQGAVQAVSPNDPYLRGERAGELPPRTVFRLEAFPPVEKSLEQIQGPRGGTGP